MISILDTNKITNELKDFFECENISQVNRDIILDYMDSLFDDPRQLSVGTINYNVSIIKFILAHIKTDLDKLTIRDINSYKRVMREWKRVNGKEIAKSTKNQYYVGLKRFLKWHGILVKNRDYLDLAKEIKIKHAESEKQPSDLLTTEEIQKMIMVADGTRDKAIIATLADSGCRLGEILSCRIKDVECLPDGCRLTFPKSKTKSRTVLLQFASVYITQWILDHPQADNPDAPLWVTRRQKNIGSKEEKKLGFKVLKDRSLYGIVTKTAERAGIKKRIHPHLFRHTAATRISKKMSEAEMKMFLGWSKTSSMPAVYIHLSNDDLDNAVRAMNGTITVEVKDEKGLKVIKCARCRNIIPSGARFCQVCGLPLTEEVGQSYRSKKQEMLAMLAQHQDVLAEIMADFSK